MRDKGAGPPPAAPAAREELVRYAISEGVRALVRYGTPSTGSLWDEPIGRPGTRYLVERRVDCASMSHLLADYLEQSRRRDCPAMIVDLDFGVPGEDRRLSRTSWPPAASTRV